MTTPDELPVFDRAEDFERAVAAATAGVAMLGFGRWEEALPPLYEAAELFGPLAEAHPEAYAVELGMTLNHLGTALDQLGRTGEAYEAAEQAVEWFTPYREGCWDGYAQVLFGFARRLRDSGDLLRAEMAYGEVITVLDSLSDNDQLYAMALQEGGDVCWELEEYDQAMVRLADAVEVAKRLTEARPEPSREASYAAVLSGYARRLVQVGLTDAGVAAYDEALRRHRRLAAVDPDHAAVLRNTLQLYAASLSDAGRHDAAYPLAGELVRLVREAGDEPRLVEALNLHSVVLSDVGEREPAVAAATEAVDRLRELLAVDPDRYAPELALNLMNLGRFLARAGRHQDGVAPSREGVQRYAELARTDVHRYGDAMLWAVERLRTHVCGAVSRESARESLRLCVAAYEQLAGTDRKRYADHADALAFTRTLLAGLDG